MYPTIGPTTVSIPSTDTAKAFLLYSGVHVSCSVASYKVHGPEYFPYLSFKTSTGVDSSPTGVARGSEGDGISLLSLTRDSTGRG